MTKQYWHTTQEGRIELCAKDPSAARNCQKGWNHFNRLEKAKIAIECGAYGDIKIPYAYDKRIEAIKSPKTAPQVLDYYARTEEGNPNVLYVLAQNPALPHGAFMYLAESTIPHAIYRALGENPSCPPEVLHRLFQRKVALPAVAKSPNASVETLTALYFYDDHYSIYLLSNPKTPTAVLAEMYRTKMEHAELRGLLAHGNCPQQLILSHVRQLPPSDKYGPLRQAASRNKNIAGEALSRWNDKDKAWRILAALQGDLSDEAYEALAYDPSMEVRCALLENPNPRGHVLTLMLLSEENPTVQKRLQNLVDLQGGAS